jgi:SPP1 family predicted phage head-tail adaptor
MGMNVNKLDRRVTVLRSELIDDGFGQVQGPWSSIGTVWAHRSDIKDGEKIQAGQVLATLQTRFTVRSSEFSRGIDAKDRLQHDGLTFDIQGTKESAEGRFQFLELTASARADE